MSKSVFRHGFLRTLPVLFLPFLIAACDGAAQREAKYLGRAEQLFAQKKYDKAALEFKNVLQINPTNVKARFGLGVIEEEAGRWRQAFGLFNQVIAQDAKHIGANLHLAKFFLVAGDLDEAEKKLRVAAEQTPDDAEVKALQAAIQLRRGQFDDAISNAEAALKSDPKGVQAIAVLVGVARERKQFDKAQQILDEALAADPKSIPLLLLRVSLNLDRDRRDAVEKDFATLFVLAPTDIAYRLTLARIYVIWKRPAAAELAIRDAIRIAPKNDSLKRLLVSFLAKERSFADAEKTFKELIASDPTTPIFSFGLAGLYIQHDASARAKEIYNSIIQKNADKASVTNARSALARLLLSEKKVAEAREQINLVLGADPGNSEALFLLARLEFDEEKFESAITRLRAVLRGNPKAVPALRLLAEAYIKTDQLDLAADTLGIAVSVNATDDRTRVRLAEVYVLQQRYDAAFELLNKVAATGDAAQEALRVKADIFSRTQRFKDASAALDELEKAGASKVRINRLRGVILLRAKDFAGAVDAFEKALDIEPAPDLVTGIISAEIALKQFDRAETRLKNYIEKSPSEAYLHNLLGEVYAQQKKPSEATDEFRKAYSLDARWSVPYLNHANLLIAAGKSDDAMVVLEEGRKKSPKSQMLHFAIGVLYHKAEKIDLAIAAYEEVLKINPRTPPAANNLAALLADYKYQTKEALDRALALMQPYKDSKDPIFMDTLGWLHFRRAEFSEAIRYLERATQASPKNPETHYHLGMAYLSNGQPALARAELEKAVIEGAKYFGIETARATLARLVAENQMKQ